MEYEHSAQDTVHITDMIMGLTYLLLMSCDIVRNSSQALTSGGTAASNPPIYCSTDVNCSIIIIRHSKYHQTTMKP